ncbi:MAG: tyrosine-type recombinase/integrase [Bryobacteraceae bacterium]
MPVHKQKYSSGKVVWCYKFDAPGSTRENRRQIKETGFATKKEAQDAEAARRIDEQKKYEMAKAGGGVNAPMPKTLAKLLDEFFAEYAEKKLAPKTVERYREQAAYLARELRDMPLTEITALHLNREWNRLLECGGHHRRTKAARPLSAKTVRNIAGVVSSAFTRAVKWGLVSKNPVEDSEPPVPKKHKAVALAPAHQELLVESASGPFLGTFLETSAGIGARRGEVLALRWSDIQDGRARIERSLSQTKQRLEFKGTKGENVRVVKIPDSVLVALEEHRKRQDEFRRQFGPDYRTDLDLIFANPDGSPLRPDSISSSVSALFKRLKIQKPKGAALHLLRHSHGSQLLANGVPLPAVSERLGHSSTYVTATVYSHAIHGQDDEAARKWEEYQQRSRAETGDAPQKGQVQ